MHRDLGSSSASAELIATMEAEHPGRLSIAVQLPGAMLPGRARVDTSLAYSCNIAQVLFPIEVLMTLPFNVLPPP